MMLKKVVLVCAVGATLSCGSSVASAQTGSGSTPQVFVTPEKLRGGLSDVLIDAGPAELIPVQVVMTAQADQRRIEAAKSLRLADRRAVVIETLREVADATQGDVLAMLGAAEDAGNADHIAGLWIANVVVAMATRDVIMQLAARDDVAYVHYDRPFDEGVLPVEPDEPEVDKRSDAGGANAGATITCGVNLVGAPNVWTIYNNRGQGAVVGVIDTGVCVSHPDLADHIWNNPGEIPGNGVDDDSNGFVDDIVGWDFDNNDNNPNDSNSHGTHTAGTVAGDGTNGNATGVAPDAQIMAIRYWNDIRGESVAWQCIQYATMMEADVISNSYGWRYIWSPNRAMWRQIVENTMASGVICVWSAGNNANIYGPPENIGCPADVPGVIAVGAIDCNQNRASFTSIGPVSWQTIFPYLDYPYPPGLTKPDVCAPGVNTLSLSNNCTGYSTKSGTSMSCPHVAGIAALMRTANPEITHEQVKQILKDTATDLGVRGPDNTYGWGLVNAVAAVEAALDLNSCVADWDGNGEVNASDVGAYLTAYFQDLADDDLDEPSDLDGNGVVNAADVGLFLSEYFIALGNGGCA